MRAFSLGRSKRFAPVLCSIFIGAGIRRAKCQHTQVVSYSNQIQPKHENLSQFSWMEKHTCKFPVSGDNIEVISTPDEFYRTLTEKAKSAKKRIVLSSLYLGSGNLERNLVKSVGEAVEKRGKNVQVRVLLDFTRGSRGANNSRSLLLSLIQGSARDVKVSLYHSPELRGWRKWLLSEKWNELVGLQHIKAYIFDDDIILSGANLSNDYFTNRQDRYVCIKNSPEIADYYSGLIGAVSSFSFQLKGDDTVVLEDGLDCHPFKGFDWGRKFKAVARRRMQLFINKYHRPPHPPAHTGETNSQKLGHTNSESSQASSISQDNTNKQPSCDTYVYPLIQMGPFGVDMDRVATIEFLKHCPQDSKLYMASGYFNLIQDYINVILHRCRATMRIYTASPLANGFFGGNFPLNHIPAVYTHVSREFLEHVLSTCQQKRVSLYEYERPDWTFHAKGLWYYPPAQHLPTATFVGSPNFGYRSVHRDLESQVLITTTNENLRHKLHEEQERLLKSSYKVTDETYNQADRRVPLYVRIAARLGRSFI